jgi:beta-glucosidase
MKNTGTITTLKHFIANNNEFRRKACNVIVGDSALREIYMPAFKAGIDAGAMAVMTSYNLVNGEWDGQSEALINGILRNELGFKWVVMSDWKSVNDAKKVVSSGLDLEMPGGRIYA